MIQRIIMGSMNPRMSAASMMMLRLGLICPL